MSRPRIAVVTDSTADIPSQEANRLGIRIIPALVTIDNKSYPDNDDFNRSDFYHRLSEYKSVPTTAAPAPVSFARTYAELFEEGFTEILSIHVSSKLSAIFNMAMQASKQFSNRVRVFDSGQLSLGLGFQAIEAATAANSGQSMTPILEKLSCLQQRIRVLAMINKLDYLQRSGRVNWVKAGIGSWLHVKMVVGLKDGMVQRLAAVRTRRRALQYMITRISEWGSLDRLAVMHTGIKEEANSFADLLQQQCAAAPMVIEATTVIGTHIGEGSIGVAALTS